MKALFLGQPAQCNPHLALLDGAHNNQYTRLAFGYFGVFASLREISHLKMFNVLCQVSDLDIFQVTFFSGESPCH